MQGGYEPPFHADYNVLTVSRTMTSFPDDQTLCAHHAHESTIHLPQQIEGRIYILQQEYWNLKAENLSLKNEVESLKQSFQALEKRVQSVDKEIDYLKWDLHNENGNLKDRIKQLKYSAQISD